MKEIKIPAGHVLYDVSNIYTLEPSPTPPADVIAREPGYRWTKHVGRPLGCGHHQVTFWKGYNREYDELHYLIGPSGLDGMEI